MTPPSLEEAGKRRRPFSPVLAEKIGGNPGIALRSCGSRATVTVTVRRVSQGLSALQPTP
jgi:hypothetical protein